VYFGGGFYGSGLLNDVVKLDLGVVPLKYEELSPASVNPPNRKLHSMHSIGTKLYIFGGEQEDGQQGLRKLNDLWVYDIETQIWKPELMFGDVPGPRSGHSTCTVGDRIYLYGGKGPDQLYRDFYIFDSIDRTWKQITTVEWPPARTDACMACEFPFFYIYGGRTVNGFDGDLFYIDLRYNTVELLSSSHNFDGPPPSAFSKCWAYTQDNETEFMLGLGETLGSSPVNTVFAYSLAKKIWRFEGSATDISQTSAFLTSKHILIAGGERWNLLSRSDVWSYSLQTKETTKLGDMRWQVYAAASAYVKSAFYLHGGGDTTTIKYRPYMTSSLFQRIELNQNCTDCSWPCSPGTYQTDSGECIFCPKGTYNSEYGASSCIKCPAGTSSNYKGNSSFRQCYLCKEGSFSAQEGAARCKDCFGGNRCSIGSSTPRPFSMQSDEVKSVQPSSYTKISNAASLISFLFEVCIAGLIGTSVFIFLVIPEDKRKKLEKVDIYNAYHTHFNGETIILKNTDLGGLATIWFILVALFIVVSAVSVFAFENIEEAKALVPLVTLEKDFPTVKDI
jgi:hypothetical protein